MPNDGQKSPLARSLEQFANRKIRGALANLGQSLPASVISRKGGIVTVKFEIASTPNSPYTLPNVTVPIIGSEYVRLPIQPGALGMVMTADAYLGGMACLGGGVADLSPRGNLSMLVWTPIGNIAWQAAIDDNALEAYGPNGVILHNGAKTAIIKVTTTENSWTAPGAAPITLNGNVIVNGSIQLSGNIKSANGGLYAGDIHTSGAIVAGFGSGDQVGLQTHTHGGVATGAGQSGAPTAGT